MYSLLHYVHLNYSTINLRVRSVFTSIFEMIKTYINFSCFLAGANRLNELFIKEGLK